MHPIVIKHFSEISAAEYHRIVQAREAVFFLEQHITEPDADEVDPQSVFLWTEEDGRVVAFLRIIPAGIVCAEASVGRVLVDAGYRRRGLVPPPDARSPAAYRPDVGSAARPHLGAGVPRRILRITGLRSRFGTYLEAGIPHVRMLRR